MAQSDVVYVPGLIPLFLRHRCQQYNAASINAIIAAIILTGIPTSNGKLTVASVRGVSVSVPVGVSASVEEINMLYHSKVDNTQPQPHTI